jgi:hypothetical protein
MLFPVAPAAADTPRVTFALAGAQAMSALLHVFYAGGGMWRDCNDSSCQVTDTDWGADSATYALYLRWKTTHDPQIPPIMRALAETAPLYPAPCPSSQDCSSWSDTPEWDAVSFMREYEVLGHDPQALVRAEAAYRFVDRSHAYALGACPMIPYQLPHLQESYVKSLETVSNSIKAALLLARATNDPSYVKAALAQYAAVRTYFLDPHVPLYSVHVLDDGLECQQVPHRFFASVNGDMIWSGIALWRATGDLDFRTQAIETAKAVVADLSDDRGVFADVQGDNDVVEPLVEAMYDLATQEHQSFARKWILRNAAAALSSRAPDGSFERFFDGPWQPKTSVWESNGGFSLEIAAAGLAPHRPVPSGGGWSGGRFVGHAIASLPAKISFDGSGVALIGTISRACQTSHVRVFVDGRQTFDQTGLWQNKSMPDARIASVLFAWRWQTSGAHTIELKPGPSGITGPVSMDVYISR